MNWQLALVAIALVAAPAATAATITIDMDDTTDIVVDPSGNYAIPFTYTEACDGVLSAILAEILLAGGELDVSISGSSDLTGVTFGSATATLDFTGCITGPLTDPSYSGTLTVSADQWAPGMLPGTVTLTDGTASDSHAMVVNYTNMYEVSTDATFPMETHDGEASFNMSLTVTANAPSMIMFYVEDPACGTIVGVPEFLNINEGDYTVGEPHTIVQEVTYSNSCSDNDMDYFEFRTVTHNTAFDDDLFTSYHQNWTFVNGGEHHSNPPSEETPAPGLFFVLGALGLVAVLRRK